MHEQGNRKGTTMPNDDYIKRSDAIKAFEDAVPDVIDFLAENMGYSYPNVEKIVGSIPAADVAPVIRCRDCKYAMMTYSGECKYCKMWMQDGIDDALYLDGDFYCAFAERKGENAAVH